MYFMATLHYITFRNRNLRTIFQPEAFRKAELDHSK
jgi:hypothetical protein